MFVVVYEYLASGAWVGTANISCRKTRLDSGASAFPLQFKLRDGNKQVCPRTLILVVGDISTGLGVDDHGQHDKAEHDQKNDQVERNQEAQKGEVGKDPRSKHPYRQMKENGKKKKEHDQKPKTGS